MGRYDFDDIYDSYDDGGGVDDDNDSGGYLRCTRIYDMSFIVIQLECKIELMDNGMSTVDMIANMLLSIYLLFIKLVFL